MSHWSFCRSERGAVLIHVAVGIVALMALSALVVDYGVMWVGRRQAQNVADSAALSAAISYSLVDIGDLGTAQNAGVAIAQQHQVWVGPPDITPADIFLVPCPPGAPGVDDTCIRADAFRNQRAGGNPLPMFFGQLVGLTQQGVRATATAQLVVSDTSECVKPFAIPDKWWDLNDSPQDGAWTPDDEFQRYYWTGNQQGQVIQPTADVYQPPSANDPGSGFQLPNDYGLQITLKNGNPQNAIQAGWFFPVIINPAEGPGAAVYRENIATCDTTVIGPGTVLSNEPGNMIGPTRQGINDLIAQDPSAWWDPSANGGKGAPAGGCMSNGGCVVSPRLVALPAFNPDAYDAAGSHGRTEIIVTKVMGFWLEEMVGNDVLGYFTFYPDVANSNPNLDPDAAFLRKIILVR